MLLLSAALRHYKREDIQKALVEHSQNKEIAVRFTDQFGKRPDNLRYPSDVMELAKGGATSFHASEELWSNPLQLSSTTEKREMDSLRIGWDLVLDIDCAVLDYSRQAADLIVRALREFQIRAVSCKFSGNKGFHIGIPFEAFPEITGTKQISTRFPECPRAIAAYLKEMIKDELSRRILSLEKGDLPKIIERTGKKKEEIVRREKSEWGYPVERLDVESFLVIDTILLSSRHLYRMPYSLHEKSLLVSVPVDPDKILEFDKSLAKPENVRVSENFKFLDRVNVRRGEAANLLERALYTAIKTEDRTFRGVKTEMEIPEKEIPEQFFPPCITTGLGGMRDGRKRFVFILLNFLRGCGWEYDRIEKLLMEWNKRNEEQLRDTYLVGPLRYHKAKHKRVLPPNCKAMEYYIDMGICKPDNLCRMIKNPVLYVKRKTQYLNKEKKPAKNRVTKSE